VASISERTDWKLSDLVITPPPTEQRYSEDQPRDADGRFGSGDGVVSEKDAAEGNFKGQGDTEDSPLKTSNVNVAAAALGAGKFIQLDQKQSVGTLLDKLATIANEAKAAGKDAPNYNLCQCQVADSNIFCAGNKGIGRDLMPQLKGVPVPGSPADSLPKDKNGDVDLTAGFIAHLADLGITSHPDTVAVDLLHSTQNELVGTKVAGIMKAGEAGKLTEQAPYIVSMDNYLLDGHHRWAAQVGQQYDPAVPNQTISADVTRVHSDIGTIVGLAHAYALAQGVPPKDATASARAAARRAWVASVRATTAAITNASDIRSVLLRDWDESEHPRDDKGEFEGGGQIEPLQGGGGTGKSGQELQSISASASLSTLPPTPDDEKKGTLEERSLATLSTYVGATVAEMTNNVYDLFQKAAEDSKAGIPWDNRVGKFNSGDTRTAIGGGSPWYDEAHALSGGNDPKDDQFNKDFVTAGFKQSQGAAIIAALSPQQSYEANVAGFKAVTSAYANPDRTLTQAECDHLNNDYRSGSLGVYVHADTGILWGKTKIDPDTGQKYGDPAKNGAAWMPSKNADGSDFKFQAGWSVGDILAGKYDPAKLEDVQAEKTKTVTDKVTGEKTVTSSIVTKVGAATPEGAGAAVMLVGLTQGVSAGGSGYGSIEKGVQIANGRNIDDTLKGEKVRSFFNCINAPGIGADPVVDSHMIEGMVVGYPPTDERVAQAASLRDNMTAIMGVPSTAGASIGAYPALADAIRGATERINAEQPGGGPGTPKVGYTNAQVQAIVWLQQIHEFPNGMTGGGKRGGKK